jgi:hypothetical protein
MAKKSTPAKGRAVAPRKTTEVGDWRSELGKSAKAAVETEESAATGGGRFFSMRAGQLTFDDAALPGNQMACVIVDSMIENVYYEGAFDPEQKTPPTCFGFGRDAKTIAVHEKVFEHSDTFSPQCGPEGGQPENPEYLCDQCPMNQWGTAEKGKGKACSNRRRLAIIPAGTYKPIGRGGGFELELFDEAAPFKEAELAYMKLPVMSVKGFATYLKSVADQFERPLWGVFTRIYVEPDPKSQFRVKFELLEVIEDEELLPVLFQRHKQATDEIGFPYLPRSDDDDAPAQRQAKAGSGKLSRKGGAAAKGSSARRR